MNDNNLALINFLNPKLGPKVICNSPSADHYEVDNLLSTEYSLKSRGFMAYYTIKPPVELEFHLLCNVSINYIKLLTTVGSQKCTGIELLAKNSENGPYISLAKAVYDKPGVIFCNRRMYKTDISHQNLHTCYFNRNTFKIFLNSIAIKIIIFRTEKSVPCLGSVEIWGTPAKYCSKVTVETISKVMQTTSNISADSCIRSQPNENESADVFQIPQDFKDDLTFEIMTIPMTLPCGKTVDQSTLDKHLEVEKSFGRKPCDPFTGNKFSEACKPILNIALKSRIDMFLIQNAHRKETFSLKRIVGRSNNDVACTSRGGLIPDSDSNENKRKREDNEQLFGEAIEGTVVKRKQLVSQCCVCKKCENLYIVSCNHLYCRNCILECCKKLVCLKCQIKFERNDVKKYYP